MNKIFKYATLSAAMVLSPFVLAAEDSPQDQSPLPGRIAYHYVGRVSLNFLDGTGIVYGYLTDLNGVSSVNAMYQGTPGESTALLTFRANINFQLLPGNGPLGGNQFAVTPTMVIPGTFQIYYTANPAHDWTKPDTFSNGQVVATLNRGLELFSVLSGSALNAGSATLASSAPFALGGRMVNLREFIPFGVSNITTGPTIPLAGSTQTTPIFAFAGYALTIGH